MSPQTATSTNSSTDTKSKFNLFNVTEKIKEQFSFKLEWDSCQFTQYPYCVELIDRHMQSTAWHYGEDWNEAIFEAVQHARLQKMVTAEWFKEFLFVYNGDA